MKNWVLHTITFSPRRAPMKTTYCIRLHACTSISSILNEFNSSFIRCARAGVSRLHVAGSLLRSYTVDENVSYTDRLSANTSFLVIAGPEAERCVSVAGTAGIVDSAGADELGNENSGPWCGEERPDSGSEEGAESDDEVNEIAGRLGRLPPALPALALECEAECDPCRCRPSI